MYKSRYRFYLIFIFILFTSFTSVFPQKVFQTGDIIRPVKLVAGVPDTVLVSDLFYAEDYKLTINPSKVINAIYNYNTRQLVFVPDSNYEGIATVDFAFHSGVYSIPVYCKRLNNHTFSFTPTKTYKTINLFGSFNNWDRQSLPMKDINGTGTYQITVPLEPGRYEYKFFADGEEILDPQNKGMVANGIGGFNSVINIPNPHDEKIFLHKISFSKTDKKDEFRFYLELAGTQTIDKSNIIALLDNQKVMPENILLDNRNITITVPEEKLVHTKMLRVIVSIDGLNSNMQMIPLQKGKPAGNSDFSWYNSMIYSLMIDRFRDGDTTNDKPVKNDSLMWKANYMGGDFKGVTEEINAGYFDSLGINTIWLSPVNDNPNDAYKETPAPHRWFSGYHGYWPIAQEKVEEKFGTFDDLKKLISSAHKHNIKILLDFVSHHVHAEHPFYKEHPDWFGKLELPDGRLNLRLWDEHRLTTWFEPYMPSYDFIHSDKAVDVVSDNAIWWLEHSGADGFRHDAVKHVPNRFWRELTQKLKKRIEEPTGKDVYQIGETFGSYDLVNSYINNGQLSAQFNFLQYDAAQPVFIDSASSFNDLNNAIEKGLDVYGTLNLMGNIMDSHDKNRFMAYADGDLTLNEPDAIEVGWNNPPKVDHPESYEKAELYYAYMFSVPGIPVIYYGSEFGMTGAADPDNRRMMRFGNKLNDNEKKMLKTVSKIVKLRASNTALRYGDYYLLHADVNTFAYIRSDFGERVLVVLNKSNEEQKLELQIPNVYSVQKAIDLISGASAQITGNKLSVTLPPRGWKMLKLESE